MNKPRECGCKGCRTCLLCENDCNLQSVNRGDVISKKSPNVYVYCPLCVNKAWPGYAPTDYQTHPNHTGTAIDYPGVFIDLDFISAEDESQLMLGIDTIIPWDLSQSGRRKQNFGPKCNFKKNRLKLGDFKGFPRFTQFVQHKFADYPILRDFQTIEQCSLEYDPARGASIDPHVDDCWIWGERIITVNLLSDSVLTMTYNRQPDRYNLNCVRDYPAVVSASSISTRSACPYRVQPFIRGHVYPIVRIPMPRRSLLVMYGAARYDWAHEILREDIVARRVCLAYREFTPPYLPGGDKYENGREVLEKAREFWD